MQGKKAGNAQSLSISRRADERVPGDVLPTHPAGGFLAWLPVP